MPVVPFIPAIIGAAGSIGGALINRSSRGSSGSVGGTSSGQLLPPGLDVPALTGLIGQQKDLAGFLTDTGKSTIGRGSNTLQAPLDFYSSILSGDRTSMMQTLAPEVAAVNAQFRAPLTEAGITGRGSALAPDLEASRQSAISSLFFKERPQAADKLTSIAQNLMSLGTQQAGMGGSILGDAAQETLNYNAIIRGLQMQQAQMPSALGQLGTSLGPILAQVLGGVFGGSGSSGPDYGPGGLQPPPIVLPDPGTYSGGDSMTSSSGFDPSTLNALLSSSQGKPDFDSSWLDKG